MTVEELRARYLKEMPRQITEGMSTSYAEWLEHLIIKKESNKQALKCPFCESKNTIPWGIDFDWNCTYCGKDFQGTL